MGTGSFPRVKCGRGVLLTTHPLLVPRSWKSRAVPLPTLWATPGLYQENFTFTSTTNVENFSPVNLVMCCLTVDGSINSHVEASTVLSRTWTQAVQPSLLPCFRYDELTQILPAVPFAFLLTVKP